VHRGHDPRRHPLDPPRHQARLPRQGRDRPTATAQLDETDWSGAQDVDVPVAVTDAGGTLVVRAVVSIYVSPRR
jgi:hypothetical protein